MGKYLMGAGEIRDRLGVSRQRVQQLIARPDFPKPYDVLQMGKVWKNADVEAWIEKSRPQLHDAEPAPETPRTRKGPRRGPRKPAPE